MPHLIPSVTYLKRLISLVNRTPLNSRHLLCTRGVYSVKVSQKSANRVARRGVRVPRHRGDRPAPGEVDRKLKTQDVRKLRRCKRRWKIMRLFAWLGNLRRLVVRHERRADNFLGFVNLGCIVILLGRSAGLV